MNRPWLICFYGPESTGKSTMARRMAAHYQTAFVPEVAREMISSNAFSEADIIRIGFAQTGRVKENIKLANRVLFCDTDLITTAIYSQTYLGVVPEELRQLEGELHYDQYFLFDIDTPWIPDGLRDLGEKRPEMFAVFKTELERRGIPYILLTGTYVERERKVIEVVDKMLAGS
jgi:HTH-type transcriptional regulator, transcriptional repressor of NAD biosynthesis genes